MKKPLISVILPYYKKIRFIFRTLKSIQNQNYKNLELIFVYDDDDKKDLKKIKPYLKKFKKSLIYENKKNKGVSISRNIGIKLAKGKYIAFIDADDVWKPNKLKYQIKQMINCKADFSYTGYNIIDEKNNLKSKRNISSSLNYNDLLKSCEIGLSTVVVKKKVLPKKCFPGLKTQEDFALWLELFRMGIKILPIKQHLSSWREVKNSLSSDIRQKIVDAFKVYYIYENQDLLRSLYNVLILILNKIIRK